MLRYLTKRLLLFIPTLVIMSFFVFFIAQFSQEDLLLQKEENDFRVLSNNTLQEWKTSYAAAQKLGFHNPSFYVSIYRTSSSDTLNRIQDKQIRGTMADLGYKIGNWEKVNAFYGSIKTILPSLNSEEQQRLIQEFQSLNLSKSQSSYFSQFPSINRQFKLLLRNNSLFNNFIPKFKWNGFANQYHLWLRNVLRGNFGASLVDNNSVNEKINNAIYWTLLLSIVSLIITFSIAIPAAFYSSFNPSSLLSKTIDKLLFLFYAIPSFWVATLLILFFASGDYLSWFPTYGLGFIQDDYTAWQVLVLRIQHLILPIIALSYGSIAFVYKQLKNSITQELHKDYVLTARAKGLSSSAIKWRQLFKNASFPLITLLGGIIPALFSGSFIIEYIFSIPGMGKLSVESILSRDFSTIYMLLLLATFFSMLGLLMADLLYYFADPRVQLSSKNKVRK